MIDKTHSDGSRWLSSNCYDMSPAPARASQAPKPDVSKPNEAPVPDQPRPKPMARLFQILGKKPKPPALNLRRLAGK
jgi:hypothetical protein